MIELDRRLVEDILFYELGLADEDLRDSYSGRFMYGDSCFGIVCDISDAMKFVAIMAINSDEGALNWVGKVKADNMGLSTIWYWPGVTVK